MGQVNRIALVTGASRGLGEVVARVLAARGYDLVISGRDVAALEQVAALVRASGVRVTPVAGDLTDAVVRSQLVEAAWVLGGLDLLVNNASALGRIGPLLEFDVSELWQIFPVNVVAPLALVQLAAPLLADRRGTVVNVTSDAAQGAYRGWGPYGASKAALELLTRTLAGEAGSLGISVVLVDPGDMRTRMHQQAYPGEDISDRPLPEVTAPFWAWLVEQDAAGVHRRRFVAQEQDAPWLTHI